MNFQLAVGRAVRTWDGSNPFHGLALGDAQRSRLDALTNSRGFKFTKSVQRSWSKGRASRAAWLTLSLLPEADRERLLDTWVDQGGGTTSFFNIEADSFLEFIAAQLPDPSHLLTFCRVEQATYRATEGMTQFTPPDVSELDAQRSLLSSSRHAAMVTFHAEPRRLLAALNGSPLPPLSPDFVTVLFGPGIKGLFREATHEEVKLWKYLGKPRQMQASLDEGYQRTLIEALITAGCLEAKTMD